MPPITETTLEIYGKRLAQNDVPDGVKIIPEEIRADGTATLKVYDRIDGFVRESSVTLRSDAEKGFVVEGDSSFVKAEASANAAAATLINAKLPKVSLAAWFDDAVLRVVFTRNKDLSNDVESFAVLTDPAADPVRKIHALQDMLVGVTADSSRYDANERSAIAATLLSLPADFWTTENFAGVPWAELYFTYDLLKKARAAHAASIGIDKDDFALYERGLVELSDETLGFYTQSLAVCEDELRRETYSRYCHERSWFEDKVLIEGITQSSDEESRCDEYDVQIASTENYLVYPDDIILNGFDSTVHVLMTPPFVAGSPDSLFAQTGAEFTEGAVNEGFEILPEVIRNHPDAAAETLRAIDETLQVKEVRAALADLSVTTIGLADEILSDPDLDAALSKLVEEVILAATSGRWVSEAAREAALDDLDKLIRTALSRSLGIVEEILDEDAPLIRSICESLMVLSLQAAQSEKVRGELESAFLEYIDVAGRILADPRVQGLITQGVGVAVKGGVQAWQNILANPQDLAEIQDALSESVAPIFDALADGLDEDGQKALARFISHFAAGAIQGGLEFAETPQGLAMAELFAETGGPVLQKLEDALAWDMMLPREQRKAARARRKEERKNAVPPFNTSGDLYSKLTYPENPDVYFSTHGTKEFERGAYEVSYHVGADKSVFPFGAIEASLDVSKKGFSVEFARKAFTNYPAHGKFFVENKILEAAPMLDAHLKSESEGASFVTDGHGNSASFIDSQGRAHYLIYQHLSVMGTNSEYLLDLWVDKDDFQTGRRGEMVIGWDVVPSTAAGLKAWAPVQEGRIDPAEVTAYYKDNFTKGWTHPEQNTGAWQLIDEDGDGVIDLISWGAAISGTESLQKLAPGPFTKNVYDIVRILESLR